MIYSIIAIAQLLFSAQYEFKNVIFTLDCKEVVDDQDNYILDGHGGMYLDTINTYQKTVCDTMIRSSDSLSQIATVAINDDNVKISLNGGTYKINAKIKRKYHKVGVDDGRDQFTSDHGYSLNWNLLDEQTYIYRIFTSEHHFGTIVRTKYGMLIEANTDSKLLSNYKLMLFNSLPDPNDEKYGKPVKSYTERFQYYVMDFNAEHCDEFWERMSH